MCTDASNSSWASMCLAMDLVIGPCLGLLLSIYANSNQKGLKLEEFGSKS